MVSVISVLSTLAMIGGGIGYFTFPMGLRMGIKSQINLKEGGQVYQNYMAPPFATNSKYYIYAITNPREVLKGAKMKFAIKGPYNFNTYLRRENIAYLKQGEQVRFDAFRQLALDEQASADLDERMWVINPILAGTSKTVRSMVIDRIPFKRFSEPVVFTSVNALLDAFGERLISRTTPRQILIGRKVALLDSITGLAARFGLSSLMPPGPPDNVFGLAYVQNRTIDRMLLWTGVKSTVDKFAGVVSWNNQTKVKVWRGRCSIINGTNGELYRPLIKEDEAQKIFLAPLCRTIILDPVNNGQPFYTQDGIKAYEYEISPRTFMGARSNPGNKCFCENPKTYDCQYDGMIGMGPCFFDSPIFFSKVNFNGVDKRIQRLVDSSSILNASLPDKQSFYLEPISGTAVQVDFNLLALIKVVRQPYMRDLDKIRNISYVPFFSVSESVNVPYKYVWPLHMVQMLDSYHEPLMAGTALAGLGTLVVRYFR